MAPSPDVVKKVLDDIREEGCYAMILMSEPGQSVIASADKNLDVTDKAVWRLRATKAPAVPATKAGAPSAPAGVTRPKPPAQGSRTRLGTTPAVRAESPSPLRLLRMPSAES